VADATGTILGPHLVAWDGFRGLCQVSFVWGLVVIAAIVVLAKLAFLHERGALKDGRSVLGRWGDSTDVDPHVVI